MKGNTSSYTCSIVTCHNTTTDSIGIVYGCLCNCFKKDDVLSFDNIDELLDTVAYYKIRRVYIHDFTYFSSYLYNYLLNNGVKYNSNKRQDQYDVYGKVSYLDYVNSQGDIYMIKVIFNLEGHKTTCEFRSAKNKTRSKLVDLIKSFNVDLSTLGVDNYTISDYSIQLEDATVNDDNINNCIVNTWALARVMYSIIKDGNTELTLTSDAVKSWIKLDKPNLDLLPDIGDELDSKLRYAYCGGLVYTNPEYRFFYINGTVICIDINSLYPYIMKEYALPYGLPSKIEGDSKYIAEYIEKLPAYIYWVAEVAITASVKDDKVPCIINKCMDKQDYERVDPDVKTDVTGYHTMMTNFDIDVLFTNYNVVSIEFLELYTFKTCNDMFHNFIEHYYGLKVISEGAKREIAKLILDSLYGRFGIKRDKGTYRPYLDNNKVKYECINNLNKISLQYIPISLFITSIGRNILVGWANKLEYNSILHMDTDCLQIKADSIHNVLKDKISDKLGDFKIEWVARKVMYVKPKAYIMDKLNNVDKYETDLSGLDYNNYNTVVKMSGAPDNINKQINWDNILSGGSIKGGVSVKNIKGGSLRYETTFKLPSIHDNNKW